MEQEGGCCCAGFPLEVSAFLRSATHCDGIIGKTKRDHFHFKARVRKYVCEILHIQKLRRLK